MDKPRTSTDVSKEYEPDDLGVETNRLLKKIIWNIEKEESLPPNSRLIHKPIARVAKYTGIPENRISLMALSKQLLQRVTEIDLVLDRKLIQDNLITYYFTKKRIPTVTELFNAVEYVVPTYVDIDMFKRMLAKMGYVFHSYPKNDDFYVVEKKTVAYERYKYLKTIQRYRKDKVPIYYIGITSINSDQEFLNLEKTIQSDVTSIQQYVFFIANDEKVQHVKIVTSISLDAFKVWLTSYVLPDLPTESVCVLEDSEIYRKKLIEVPTINSLKVDMIEWLEDNNIPCDMDMSKSELFKLIETCTNTNKNTFVIDNIVQTYNHTLLRLPECIKGLSISALVLGLLNNKIALKCLQVGTTVAVLTNITGTQMNSFSVHVQKEEERLLEEDIKVDNMLDELMEITKQNSRNQYTENVVEISDSD